jgi:hypothetical protein
MLLVSKTDNEKAANVEWLKKCFKKLWVSKQ